MKEKILLATLDKIFEVASVDLICPSTSNLEKLSKEEISSLYEKTWRIIFDVHGLAFDAINTKRLLESLNL